MSYCWRLQYYCKLGAVSGVGPIYYVSQLPQQAIPVQTSAKSSHLPRVRVEGLVGLAGTVMTLHHAGGKGNEPPVCLKHSAVSLACSKGPGVSLVQLLRCTPL
uniref:Uncharacterized protein n=1 Tax=Oryctolagus cuniculus TaxID=9986 RepID=A0A5F9D9S1_RABIT